MKKHFLLSLMAMLLPLATWAQTKFTISVSPTNEATSIIYDGVNTPEQFEVAVGVDGIEGVELNSDWYEINFAVKTDGENEDYQLEQIDVKSAGTYMVKVTAKSGTLYQSYESAKVEFKVERKPLGTITLKAGTITYGDEETTADVLRAFVESIEGLATSEGNNQDDEFADALGCLELTRYANETGKTVGKYHVSVKGKTEEYSSNYSYTPGEDDNTVNVPMTIVAKTINLDNKSKVYNGTETTIQDLISEYNISSSLVGSDNVTLSLEITSPENAEKMQDVNVYTLKAGLEGTDNGNYSLSANTVTYTISKAAASFKKIDGATLSKTYDNNAKNLADLTNQFEIEGIIEDDVKSSISIRRAVGEDVVTDGYAINYYVNYEDGKDNVANPDLDNYNITAISEKFTINKKNLSENDITIEFSEDADLSYQGVNFDPAGMFTLKYGEITVPAEAYTCEAVPVEEDGTVINATDKFFVKVTAKDDATNYSGSNTETGEGHEITKATLTFVKKENVTIGKTYGEADPENLLTAYYDVEKMGFKGEDRPESIEFSLIRETGENVGSYIVRPAKEGVTFWADNYGDMLDNYTFNKDIYDPNSDATKFVISKKDLTYSIVAANKTYNANTSTPAFTVTSENLVVSEDLGIDDKIDAIFTTAPVIAIKNGATAKDAGKYELVVTNAESVAAKNYNPIWDEEEGFYTINRVSVTALPLDAAINYGEQLPEDYLKFTVNKSTKETTGTNKYPNKNIQLQGLVTTDNAEKADVLSVLGESLQLYSNEEAISEEDAVAKVGEYTIGFNAEVTAKANSEEGLLSKNYIIILETGTLTVEGEHELVLDVTAEENNAAAQEGAEEGTEPQLKPTVSELLKAYNGQSVEKVTIKNLKNITYGSTMKKGLWYSLVLPFDIRVRDLSRALDYAIVNIPDVSKGIEGEAYFKLTMDVVPANTLMLVKIDEDKKWADDVVLEFVNEDGIVINYNPVPNKETSIDKAGNKFMPVYSMAKISKDNEWLVYYGDGMFHNASEFGMPEINVYPLNGYVEVNVEETKAHSIRIFVEDIDGTVTAINAVESDAAINAEGWYTINGVKLNAEPTEKGIYINNGKKVVIK